MKSKTGQKAGLVVWMNLQRRGLGDNHSQTLARAACSGRGLRVRTGARGGILASPEYFGRGR